MKVILCFWLFLACAITGCSTTPASRDATLYHQLGEREGITAITDKFIELLAWDQTLFKHFADADVERFREKFIEHICETSGGPCEYTGDSMVEVHTGMNITVAEFNHTVDMLVKAMNEVGTPHPVQNKLLARLAPMRGDVIKR